MFIQLALLLTASFCVTSLNCFSDELPESKDPVVLLKTNKGEIKIQLRSKEAPITVANFLSYVKKGFYDHTIFHRVIKGFMVQGGGMEQNMSQKKTEAPIKNEATNGLKNRRGSVAMARTSDVNSATAQFFINTVDNDFLNYKSPASYGYAVFGEVIEGMDVVDRIEAVKTGAQDVPVETIVIEKASVVE